LPDGLFSNQKSQFGFIFEGLAIDNLGIFYDHLVSFTAIGNILWSFGIFFPVLYFVTRKIRQPWAGFSDMLNRNIIETPLKININLISYN
jgi:hypothetical protein